MARLNDDDVHQSIWHRYEQYRTMNRGHCSFRAALHRPHASHPSYPRSNYYRDYYTGNNYEDEDGILLNNEYDDFGDDFFHQEENGDEFDIPFRKYGTKNNNTRLPFDVLIRLIFRQFSRLSRYDTRTTTWPRPSTALRSWWSCLAYSSTSTWRQSSNHRLVSIQSTLHSAEARRH